MKRDNGFFEAVIVCVAVMVWALWANITHAAPCEQQPILNHVTVTGGPFFDCGMEASLRVPTPTSLPHALEVDAQSTCILSETQIQSWMYPNTFPDAYIVASNIRVANQGDWLGSITFTGVNVVWDNIDGGVVEGGFLLGPNAQNIQVQGVCVPEPDVAFGLLAGVIGLCVMRPALARHG